MLGNVVDGGPTSSQQWVNVSRLNAQYKVYTRQSLSHLVQDNITELNMDSGTYAL